MENKEEVKNKIAVTFYLKSGNIVTLDFVNFTGSFNTKFEYTYLQTDKENLISFNPALIEIITYKSIKETKEMNPVFMERI